MPSPLQDQVVVITGASSGIGRLTALKFGQGGASVVLAARSHDELESVAAEIRHMGASAHVVPTDVADWGQVDHLAQETIRTFGRIDTWVNNAAVSVYGTVEETTVEEMARIVQVNVLGVMYGVKAALPHLRRQGRGTIINVGSVESRRAVPYHSVYAGSKHAVKGFTETLRMELEHQKAGIDVVLIMPASINTPFFEHARSKLGTLPRPIPPVYHPELVADAILNAAQKPQREIYVGGASWMLAKMERLSPALTDRLMLTQGGFFKVQESDQPDNPRDNLFQPSGPSTIEGRFAHLTKPSPFTRLVQLKPAWGRLIVLPAAVAGAAAVLRRR